MRSLRPFISHKKKSAVTRSSLLLSMITRNLRWTNIGNLCMEFQFLSRRHYRHLWVLELHRQSIYPAHRTTNPQSFLPPILLNLKHRSTSLKSPKSFLMRSSEQTPCNQHTRKFQNQSTQKSSKGQFWSTWNLPRKCPKTKAPFFTRRPNKIRENRTNKRSWSSQRWRKRATVLT